MKISIFGKMFALFAEAEQREKAVLMVKQYFLKPQVLVLAAILLGYIVLCCAARAKKREKASLLLSNAAPWMYLLTIFGITVFNRGGGTREIRWAFDAWFTKTGFHESNVLGFLCNLMMYVPYGYLLRSRLKQNKKTLVSVLIVVLTSLAVETAQFVFALGVSATDDVAANVLGGIAGIIVSFYVEKRKSIK